MKTFEIEYTTNVDDRKKAIVEGKDKTDAYLSFVVASPMHYIITEMKEIRKEMKMFNLRSENGVHIVSHNGKEKTFLSFLNALNYIRNGGRENV